MQSIFKILLDAAGDAFALSKVIIGQAINGTINGIAAFAFRDSSGQATMPQLNSEGAVVVSTDAGTTIAAPAGTKTASQMETAGVGVRVEITKLALNVGKTYTKLSANVTATRWTKFEVVKIEDVGGTPVEEILGYAVIDAGQTNFKIGLDADKFNTDGTTNTKELYLYASHLDNKASDVFGKVSCNEIA